MVWCQLGFDQARAGVPRFSSRRQWARALGLASAVLVAALLVQFAAHRQRLSRGKLLAPPDYNVVGTRFHFVPRNNWHKALQQMDPSASNTLDWRGQRPVPPAPTSGVWMLPCTEDLALHVARCRDELVGAGWRVLTSNESLLVRLCNKVNFAAYAKELGLQAHLPQHYSSPDTAQYPCMLKAAVGCFGRGVYIVESKADTLKIAKAGFGSKWLLQELIPGQTEYSTSLLVHKGRILDSICQRYVYSKKVYVWPNVDELSRETLDTTPESHLAVMRKFLRGYSGICNFNYKLREDGSMAIFEINARVGADLACDSPRGRARAFFERLDALPP